MEAQVKEFKKQLNQPILYFTVCYVVYTIWRLIMGYIQEGLVVAAVGVVVLGYLYLFRPYRYEISRHTFTICKRIGKNREINIMDVETVCDPLPKMTKLITNAHSYEMYLVGGKRITVAPKDQMGFVDALIKANKRMHCQVKEYNETHRKIEKKRKRENRKEKQAAQAGE